MATIRAANPFNAEDAAKRLREAMKGMGTDEKAIIQVLTTCNNVQRQELALKFKTMYGKDLIADLKSELGGKLEDAVIALMTPSAEYDARELRQAMKGAGTDEETLIEILASRNNAEIHAIKAAYNTVFKRDLEKDLMSETSGHFKRILVSLVQGNRDESGKIDIAKAQADAQALHQAGEKKWGTDESEFNRVFMTSGRPQLKATCDEYLKISKYDLERVVEKEMSGNMEKAYVALIETARDMPGYFAKRIHRAMSGAGTEDRDLIRAIITRSERDLEQVKASFVTQFKKSMDKMISSDCSGDYKKLLLAVCGF